MVPVRADGFHAARVRPRAYGLALLHLLAHSLYKAHAFLSSGRAVEQQLLRSMMPPSAPASPLRWVLAARDRSICPRAKATRNGACRMTTIPEILPDAVPMADLAPFIEAACSRIAPA